MGSNGKIASALPFSSTNKHRRQNLYILQKKTRSKEQRDSRLQRRKEETQNPKLREDRLARNVPLTLDQKRVWDEVDDVRLGLRVDVERLKRRRLEKEGEPVFVAAATAKDDDDDDDDDDDANDANDSMLGSDSEAEAESDDEAAASQTARQSSLAPSIASTTNVELTPTSLAIKFPSLFSDAPPPTPKILVTTSLNSTLHREADLVCTLFPNSNYIRRSAHRYAHKYSLREICKFASNRDYTAVVLLKEDQKKPTGLTVVCLPSGPSFHFSISNWLEGRKIPGHGNPTNHYPEILLNNFKTPLGLLTARLFMTMFPPRPEFQGRQVVTMHNQRDFIFVRRHRYIFRQKRDTEKSVVGADGKEMEGVKEIRAGLQELGPRFTLRLRRVDKGIGRAGSQGEDGIPWEWKPRMDKERKAFNL